MDVIQTIESAAGAAVEAVEHPFHTIGHRLTAIGQHIASLMGHPYGAPPMVDALTTLHSVLIDLHQEVAELRTPCPCRPASTNAAPARSVAEVATVIDGLAASPADLAEFAEWKRAKAAAELTNQTGA